MTEAEKALELFDKIMERDIISENITGGEWRTIRKALQGVDECREAFELTKRLWLKQTDENMKLKAKSQILLKALEYQAHTQKKQAELLETRNFRGQVNADTVAHNLKLNAAHALKSIAAFNSDETGVGL